MNPSKNQGLRQLRISPYEQIDQASIRELLQQAIANEKAGKRIATHREGINTLPDALAAALTGELRGQFEQLTRGRQREYIDYIADAKREATRQRRVDKAVELIKAGRGLNDHYR